MNKLRNMSLKGMLATLLLQILVACGHVFNDELQDCPNEINEFMQSSYMIPYGVPHRALKTLPPQLYVTTSIIPDAGLGVFSSTFIPRFTWLGEYEGILYPSSREDTESVAYQWLIFGGDDGWEDLLSNDALYEHTSNWARYVNMARNGTELNVWPVFCYNKVYYITIRDIHPTQELFTYYGSEYAEELDIDPSTFPKFN